MMHCHCDVSKVLQWCTLMDPWKPEMRPGVWEGVNVFCLASRARHEFPRQHNTIHFYIKSRFGMESNATLMESVIVRIQQDKGIILLELIPLQGTVLQAVQGNGNKCDHN